jgi:putative transcriptional regulator
MYKDNGMVVGSNDQHEEGSPLKELRLKLGLSQQNFATALGVTTTTISRWESGKRSILMTMPQMAALIALLRSVEWDIDDFFARAKAFETACLK